MIIKYAFVPKMGLVNILPHLVVLKSAIQNFDKEYLHWAEIKYLFKWFDVFNAKF